jgi:Co/Zn/Cd efflux system component
MPSLRKTLAIVCGLNLAYFFVEFGAAVAIGSVSLTADSVDFLEDASVNLLILLALNWAPSARARLGKALVGILLIPAMAALWALWSKYMHPAPPEALTLSAIGFGALAVNLFCAFLLAGHKNNGGSLMRAAFLSSRNDAAANVAIILAGAATAFTSSVWPDVLVGLAIIALNIDAATEVWEAANQEEKQMRA